MLQLNRLSGRKILKRYLFYVEENYSYGILRPIQRVIREWGDEVAWLPVDEDFDKSYFHEDEKVFDDVRQAIAWNPCAVLAPGNFVPDFIPGIKVMVTHGLVSEKRRKKDGFVHHFIERGLFDLYIGHGPNTTAVWERMARQAGYFEVAECGWSKLDPLFDGSLKAKEHAKPVVFFASTFSPRLTAAPQLIDTVRELVESKDWQWLVQFHPKMPEAVIDQYRQMSGDKLEVVDGPDTLPLLLNADVMLCDTSSIISEFALLQKPVVTFQNQSPKPFMINVTSKPEVGPAIELALSRPTAVMAAIEEHTQQTHPYMDGCSSERVLQAVDKLLEKGLGHLKAKPRNLIRHLKMRKQLGY
jgi:hypothetical protein